jgi:hypothetical protein
VVVAATLMVIWPAVGGCCTTILTPASSVPSALVPLSPNHAGVEVEQAAVCILANAAS